MTPDSEIPPAQAAKLLDELTAIVARACAVIRAVSPATVSHRLKPDQSPVTAADEASEAVILQGLARLLPDVPVVSEEMAGNKAPPPSIAASSWSIRSTAPANSSPAAISSPSISRLSRAACRLPASSRHRTAARSGAALSADQAERLRLLPDGADQAAGDPHAALACAKARWRR